MHFINRQAACLAIASAMGCGPTALHSATARSLEHAGATLNLSGEPAAAPQTVDLDGSLAAYLGYAFANSPALRARFETWRAMTYRPAQQRRLPEPTVTYAGFVRSVQTRVGPQRHRLGVSQWFPWPTKLRAGSDAAELEAVSAQRQFEAHALEIGAEVATAYWHLWKLERHAEVLTEEVVVLASLSEQVRVRVEVGTSNLADLTQVDLSLSRARDRLAGLEEATRVGEARLVRVLGAPVEIATPIRAEAPSADALEEPLEALYTDAGAHPQVQTFAALRDAQSERVREAEADRAPSFGLGVDWILTGPSMGNPAPPDTGMDAVALSLSVKVPLWGFAYKAAGNEARAKGAAWRAREIDARNGVIARVREQAARIRDDVRRVRVHDTTLVPQAEAAFESVLASYAAGRSTVGELLLTQTALLGLKRDRVSAQADYATDLAELERVVGRPVRTTAAPNNGDVDDQRQ